jgi:hypothetical protein
VARVGVVVVGGRAVGGEHVPVRSQAQKDVERVVREIVAVPAVDLVRRHREHGNPLIQC